MVKNIFKKQGGSKKTKKPAKRSLNIKDFKKSLLTLKAGLIFAVVICVGLVGLSGWLWWSKIFMNPERAFQDMLANNLRTSSFTRHTSQKGSGEGIDQISYLSFYAPEDYAQSTTVLTQRISGIRTSAITTETIGTNSVDFVRYTAANNIDGLPGAENVKGLIGTWAKREANPSNGQQVTFLNETLFGFVPFGNFTPDQRSKLVGLINQKGLYKQIKVERKMENKRPVYKYILKINPQDLVTVLKEHAMLLGSSSAAQLDPAQYAQTPDVQVEVTVDIFSRQLVEIENQGSGRLETYSGQNLYRPINKPNQAIPIDELQKKIQGQPA